MNHDPAGNESQSAMMPVDFDPFAGGDISSTVPATESQREIWASAQMGNDASCAYNQSLSMQMRGTFDPESLCEAFRQTIARHESLRATFSPDGQVLCINAAVAIEVPLVDLSGREPSERRQELEDLRWREVTEPFELERGPLVRATIVRLAPEDHVLLLSAHHIICDGWSLDVVMEDLGLHYSALRRGEQVRPEEPDRFSDYALLLQRQAKDGETDADTRYWLEQFSDSIPVLDLPVDRSRPPARSYAAGRRERELDPALVAGLKRTGSGLGCTFVTTLLAGFKAFLYRLTGQSDLVVGLPAAGQSTVGQDRLVGHCVNLLPLRSRLDEDAPFSEYLRSLRSAMLDAYEHQALTFGALLRDLPLARDPSRIPLVPVVFNMDQGIDGGAIAFEGLEIDIQANPRAFENFEVFLNFIPNGQGLKLECHYKTDLFDGETIEGWLEDFEVFLASIASDPGQAIRELEILASGEKQKVLVEWNQTAQDYPRDRCVHELFQEQAARRPDKEAVSDQECSLTYAELDRRSNQLAHRLRSLGAGPGTHVALFMERSVEMVVALLSILKSGAAYVPLDAAFPKGGYPLNASTPYMLCFR